MRRKTIVSALLLMMLVTFVPAIGFANEFTDEDENKNIDSKYEAINVANDGEFEIWTVDDLYNMNSNMSGNYKLMTDIDLSDATSEGGDYCEKSIGWVPIGLDEETGNVEQFTGELDGNGYKITGLNSNGYFPKGYAGLIAWNAGIIENLSIGCDFSGSVSNSVYIGAIAGRNNGVITKCNSNGSIQCKGDRAQGMKLYVGGIAGLNSSESKISECFNTAVIDTDVITTSINTPYAYAGGIVAVSNSDIVNCYNVGNITNYDSNGSAGGIAGSVGKCSVGCCYNIGNVLTNASGKDVVAGKLTPVAAPTTPYATVANCYYLESCGKAWTNAIALTEAKMQNKSHFGNFDFTNVWVISLDTNYKYPQLRNNWQEYDDKKDALKCKHNWSLVCCDFDISSPDLMHREYYECKNCEIEKTELKEHNYMLASGTIGEKTHIKKYVCEGCNREKTESHMITDVIYKEYDDVQHTEYAVCEECGNLEKNKENHFIKTTYDTIGLSGHKIVEKCSKCGYENVEEGDHTWVLLQNGHKINRTYHIATYGCSKCGETYSEDKKSKHCWDALSIDYYNKTYCKKTWFCNGCNATKSKKIKHKYTFDEVGDSHTSYHEAYYSCNNCGDPKIKREKHKWAWEEISSGSYCYQCKLCDYDNDECSEDDYLDSIIEKKGKHYLTYPCTKHDKLKKVVVREGKNLISIKSKGNKKTTFTCRGYGDVCIDVYMKSGACYSFYITID